MAKNIRRELDRLRLPDLQQRFREVIGEDTRCPNRTFLIRRISETLAARAVAPVTAPANVPAPATEAAPAESAQSPNSAATSVRAAPPRRASPGKPTGASTRGERPQRGRFKSMTIDELQTAYLSIVGRPTGSTDRRYLIWKIREAEKGRVPVGPRETRTPDQEAATETRILPLRLDAPSVAAIDATWRAQGLKSRMEFFRRALGHYLAYLGAHGAAAMFAAP
jgi:hypothetical protein